MSINLLEDDKNKPKIISLMQDWVFKRVYGDPEDVRCLSHFFRIVYPGFKAVRLIFLKIDAINHYTQGVYDTMTDMIVCFLGGLIFLFLLTRSERKGKKDPLLHSLETFYKTNLQGR